MSSTEKFVANMEAVSLWQSAQLQMKLPRRPGGWRGCGVWGGGLVFSGGKGGERGCTNASWTAPQKQVAVASCSLE